MRKNDYILSFILLLTKNKSDVIFLVQGVDVIALSRLSCIVMLVNEVSGLLYICRYFIMNVYCAIRSNESILSTCVYKL